MTININLSREESQKIKKIIKAIEKNNIVAGRENMPDSYFATVIALRLFRGFLNTFDLGETELEQGEE